MKYLLFLFFCSTSLYSQVYIDMTKELSDIKKNLLIDGNILRRKHNIKGDLIVRGKDMKLANNARIILNNVIIQLTGSIILEDEAKVFPKFIESYIFCKSSDQWESKNIIIKSKFNDVKLEKSKYIKKIKGNPKIYIYDASGQKVYAGPKDNLSNLEVPLGRYDLRVEGKSFESSLLFY